MQLGWGDWSAEIAPARGGALLRLDWRGAPVLRPARGPSMLDVACFPLVPFSNRIANGRFVFEGQAVSLPANLAAEGEPHAIHGLGWQSAWQIEEAGAARAVWSHRHTGGAWPWRYRATQSLRPVGAALELALTLTNDSDRTMPAGLGFHPYFPRTPRTVYHGLHRCEWQRGADRLPCNPCESAVPRDWWQGRPVETRARDTIYAGRAGPLTIAWPERGLTLVLTPAPALDFTVIYTPAGADFFCVEPVSHLTDAHNRPGGDNGLWHLLPGESRSVAVTFAMMDRASEAKTL
ncbi:MAG: aldose 1-epimerase [Sphingomonadales bacterium]|nr:aldose 1-epimerase [Sphingomonadales bacterium]